MEAVEVMKSTMPIRVPFANVYTRFKGELPKVYTDLGLVEYVVRVVATACEMPHGTFKLGSTLLFVRARSSHRLLELVTFGQGATPKGFAAHLQAMLAQSKEGGPRETAATVIVRVAKQHLERRRRKLRKPVPGSVKDKRLRAEARDLKSHRRAGMDRALERTAVAVYKQQAPRHCDACTCEQTALQR